MGSPLEIITAHYFIGKPHQRTTPLKCISAQALPPCISHQHPMDRIVPGIGDAVDLNLLDPEVSVSGAQHHGCSNDINGMFLGQNPAV